MPSNMKLWRVLENDISEVRSSSISSEEQLEDWIATDPSLLGLDILIIGRQVPTEFGGRLDLLAVNSNGDVIVIELKRDRTPRDVIAQILDYASWVKHLGFNELESIARTYLGTSFVSAYSDHFGSTPPETLNSSHSMIIVASEFDGSSERIVQYLADEYQVNINGLFFSVFEDEHGKILGRAWLMDPESVQDRADARKQAPWSGYWFVNVGEGDHRNWDDNLKYGFIGAGQGFKYSNPLRKLQPGSKIFAYMKGHGYVGYGEVLEPAVMVKDFQVGKDEKSLLDYPLKAPTPDDNRDDPKLAEWAVRIDWKKSFSRENARFFKGGFANQNIVCKLRHPDTVEFLHEEFDIEGDDSV